MQGLISPLVPKKDHCLFPVEAGKGGKAFPGDLLFSLLQLAFSPLVEKVIQGRDSRCLDPSIRLL